MRDSTLASNFRSMAEVHTTAKASSAPAPSTPPAVLMVGTGEYTTGYGESSSKTDKGAGGAACEPGRRTPGELACTHASSPSAVVAITVFDLRKRGLVGDVYMCGVNGTKFPAIRAHMQAAIAEAYPQHGFDISCATFPPDDQVDPQAYLTAIDALPGRSIVIIFTPDDTHFDIAMAAIRKGHHVLVTKPAVKTLAEHTALADAAREAGNLCAVEVHKRWDPMYADARDRLRASGDFSFLDAYMSQPKLQLKTFKSWAGIASDISYYLNSHHVDFHEWCMQGRGRPIRVTASAATGVGQRLLQRHVNDTITLLVQWENLPSGTLGTAVYTASWIAPSAEVHSQQRFFAMTHGGEVRLDQAHRGYSVATDSAGFASVNPLFMKYTPSEGTFAGQGGYGYRSFEAFIQAAVEVNAGKALASDFDESGQLATIHSTLQTTAILEAGARSLAAGGHPVTIQYESATALQPQAVQPQDTTERPQRSSDTTSEAAP